MAQEEIKLLLPGKPPKVEGRRISPLVIAGIGAGVAIATGVALYLITRAEAAPPPPVKAYRCVYCPATFSTEAELVGHMESSHPGKPYLVYAYLSKDTVGFDYIPMDGWSQKDWITVYAKVFVPAALAADEKYGFWLFFYKPLTYGYWSCAPSTNIGVKGPAAEGFYTGENDIRPVYLTYLGPGGSVVDVPPGTYPLYSTCFFVKDGYLVATPWSNVDTGLTVTVV